LPKVEGIGPGKKHNHAIIKVHLNTFHNAGVLINRVQKNTIMLHLCTLRYCKMINGFLDSDPYRMESESDEEIHFESVIKEHIILAIQFLSVT